MGYSSSLSSPPPPSHPPTSRTILRHKMPLLDLPNEILLTIADNLDYRSLACCIATCGHFQRLFTPGLYRSVLREDKGVTGLRYAASRNSPAVAQIFIERYGVSPNICLTDEQHTSDIQHMCMHMSAHLGSAEVISVLIKNGANPNVRTPKHRTPLHAAAAMNMQRTVKALLAHGADPTLRDKLEQTPLHLAAKKGHAGTVTLLLRQPGVGVDDTCKDPQNEVDGGYTALHGAADFGHLEVARELLRCGAQVDAKIDQSEWTPLGCAAAEGYEAVVRLLLEAGAEVNVTPEVPLRLAVDGKWCDEVLKLLLERGANVDTAIHGLYHVETANRLVEFAAAFMGTNEEPMQTQDIGEHSEMDLVQPPTYAEPAVHFEGMVA